MLGGPGNICLNDYTKSNLIDFIHHFMIGIIFVQFALTIATVEFSMGAKASIISVNAQVFADRQINKIEYL